MCCCLYTQCLWTACMTAMVRVLIDDPQPLLITAALQQSQAAV